MASQPASLASQPADQLGQPASQLGQPGQPASQSYSSEILFFRDFLRIGLGGVGGLGGGFLIFRWG